MAVLISISRFLARISRGRTESGKNSRFSAWAAVRKGVVKKSKPIRVLRDNTVIFEGELESLRRFKENVDEVRVNTECGIGVKAYNDVQPGDQIECFERIEVQRTL